MSKITIKSGNTLSQLVYDYNKKNNSQLTVDQVAKANKLADPNKIIAGKTLTFPDTFEKATKAARKPAPRAPAAPTGPNAKTLSAVETMVKGLKNPGEQMMVAAKANELIAGGYSIEKTSPERFAANMAGEISEHIGAGLPASPQLHSLVNDLMFESRSVLAAHPDMLAGIQSNLAKAAPVVQGPVRGSRGRMAL